MAKIVHIITRLDMGGSAQNTLATCVGLADRYETVLIHGPTRESRMPREERLGIGRRLAEGERRGLRVVASPWLVRRISPVFDCLALIDLWRCLVKEKPDIVHTHTSKAGVIGRLAARLAGVKRVIHTPHGHVFEGHFAKPVASLFLRIERFMDRLTTITVALTAGEAKDYLSLEVTSPEKLTIVHSGVDIATFSDRQGATNVTRRQFGIPEDAFVIGSIGWLISVKGPDLLLEAMDAVWPRFPHAVVVLVGKGDMEADLKQRVALQQKEDRVFFLGWRSDIPEILPLFDIVVLPSRNEGMGRVLVEAMAAGKPLVGADVGGIPDIIEPMKNGLLFPREDVAALALAISSLLASPDTAAQMGVNGRIACARFGLDRMLEALAKLYQSVMDGEGRKDEG